MELTEKEIKKIVVLAFIFLLGVLAFFLVKPILLSIIGGMILAYVFMPVYNRIHRKIKRRNLSAIIVSIMALLVIIIPIWVIAPVIMQEIFDIFRASQNLDIPSFISKLFPNASQEFITQITVSLQSFVSNITSTLLNKLLAFLLDLPGILLQLAVIALVFFFTLRDGDKLGEFVSGLSPLKPEKEKIIIKKFKDITNSIVYGQVIVGIVQGIVAGVGLFIFGVPKALLLSILAIFMSIIPVIGPAIVWVPAAIYLFASGNSLVALIFVLYNLIITSTIDNVLRTYIVARKTELSAVITLIGMIGGLLIFGLLGLILGPLIMAYLIILLEAYKNKTLSSMFAE